MHWHSFQAWRSLTGIAGSILFDGCTETSGSRIDRGALLAQPFRADPWLRSGGWFPGGDGIGDEVVHDRGVFDPAEMPCTVQDDQPRVGIRRAVWEAFS